MARGLSYADAAVLLGGGRETKIVAALDALVGGALLAATAGGSAFALGLFDAKGEFFRLSTELVGKLGEQLRGLNRYDRTQRLEAAHAVTVVAAYFECLSKVDLPRELRPTKAEQLSLVNRSYGGGLRDILRTPPPVPAPHLARERIRAELGHFYRRLSQLVYEFLAGLIAWERLSKERRSLIVATIAGAPDRAVARYEEMFRRLALEFPEFGYWANQLDHQATRASVDLAFTRLSATLERLRIGQDPAGARLHLTKAYQAVLRRPGQLFDDLRVPPVERCYVSPNFRVGQPQIEDITRTEWWERQPLRSDLQDFLVGHLTSPLAADAPLVVLGHPGAGKSLLTQMLAARLPASDFLTVRVPLREVPADADLQSQIEMVVRADTGANTTWPELVATAGDAMPVVLLDGFDELLQATGQSQSNYLERIAAFQQREAELGRPAAVVVTSRITVADRARPVHGAVTLLLDSFDDKQIELWLAAWAECNAGALARRGVRPMPAETALRYEDLARQPLLLLLLALYDAEGNGLHCEDRLNEADLYERLLTGFTRREVRKSSDSLTDSELDVTVAREMRQLSLVAFAMFNRNQLWVTESELDADLGRLLDDPTPADLLVGRFYFVYAAQALHNDQRIRTYEFLHATFGEFLVARLVVEELSDLADDRLLHALLSFAPLTMRLSVVEFVGTMLEDRPDAGRITDLLLGLFHNALQPRRLAPLPYEPARLSVPARVATYSANLFVLAALAAGEITSAQLFPGRDDHAVEWTRTAQLWRSQLPAEGWTTLATAFSAFREWDGEIRVIRLVPGGDGSGHSIDPLWTYNLPSDHSLGFLYDNDWVMRAEVDFAGGRLQEVGLHNLEPFTGELGNLLMTFHNVDGEGMISAARALIELWLASGQSVDPAQLAHKYETCVWIAARGFAPADDQTRSTFRNLVLHQLRHDVGRLPRNWARSMVTAIGRELPVDDIVADEFITEVERIGQG